MNEPSSDEKLWAGLSWLGLMICMIPTIVILLVKKDEPFVKFHSLQALVLGVGSFVIQIVLQLVSGVLGMAVPLLGVLGGLALLVVSLGFLGYWIYLMVMAFTGKDTAIPVVGDFIRSNWM